MHSPRTHATFHLTNIKGKVASLRSPHKFSRSFEMKFQTNSVSSDGIARLKEQAAELKAQNAQLKFEIENLRNHDKVPEKRQALSEQFEIKLTTYLETLAERRKRISTLENQVMVFRAADKEKEEPFSFRHTRQNPRKSTVLPQEPPKHTKRSAKPFPPPSLLPRKRTDPQRAQNLKSRDELIERALYLERMILIQKMKLKICHDHRDLATLREDLEAIEEEPEVNEEDEVQRMKQKITILKERIEREKARIKMEKAENIVVNAAAMTIQSAWRGYMQRHNV